jgi:AcrR family transcriptional regulator
MPEHQKAAAPATKAPPMRERIIAAAVDVIADRGIAAATTKEIARAAGVSEGSLYNHFANKNALIAATMADLAGGIRSALMDLFGRVGQDPLAENLARVAEQVIAFYRRILPVTGPVLGDPGMLAHVRLSMPEQGVGPLRGHEALAGYFTAEQNAGRVAADAHPQALAALLLGACHQYAFLILLTGPEQMVAAGMPDDVGEYARQVAAAVCRAAGGTGLGSAE